MKIKSIRTIIYALGIALIINACGNKKQGEAQLNEYAVRTLDTTRIQLQNSYPASIQGKQDIEIRPKISGFITKLCVDEGSIVKKGQLLFIIDDAQYKEALDQAKAAERTAELTYKNKQELYKEHIIGDYELETAKNSYISSKATLNTAKQNLAYCHITSPSNGIVGSIPYRVGSLVSSASASALTTVSNIDQMYIYFSMSEKQLLEMTRKAGSAEAALKTFPAVKLQLADGSIYSHEGKVTTISGVINRTTGAVTIRANFDNPEHLLKSGGSGSIIIPYYSNNAILIPQNATKEVQDKYYVYKIDANNTLHYTAIEIADINNGQDYIVTSGLQKGDRIVVHGAVSLRDGMTIKPITEKQAEIKIEQAASMGNAQSK